MISKINANPIDPSIVTLSQEISSVDASVVCSSAEQALLRILANELEKAAEVIATSLTEVLDQLNGRN